jgi:hypothetical protein
MNAIHSLNDEKEGATIVMANSYGHQRLVEQRVADLRRDAVEIGLLRQSRHPQSSPRRVRAATGHALVRLGERLAPPPSGTPVTR